MNKKSVVILGARGMLGQALTDEFLTVGYKAIPLIREDCDTTCERAILRTLDTYQPFLVINATAHNGVDLIEQSPVEYEKAYQVNAAAPGILAKACWQRGSILVHYSTDYVFSGNKQGGYDELCPPDPISKYGETKALGEVAVRDVVDGKNYLIRLSRLFGRPGTSFGVKKSFVDAMLGLVLEKHKTEISVVDEEVSSPTYAPDLARFTRLIVEEQLPSGIYHGTNSSACTWYDFADKIFEYAGLSPKLIPVDSSAYPRPAPRPAFSELLNTKGPKMRHWEDALKEYLN